MVIKEALFKGKKTDELKKMSLQELALILPSDSRRKIRKLTDAEKKLLQKIEKAKKPVKTHSRSMIILPSMIGKTVSVHDGHAYQPVMIIQEMIGHRLGEFALTRRRVTHNAPGIGATKSSSSLSVK
jgi:small subunit ribosomal protein S19